MITTWYLHSHRTWDRLCHSCIGSSFLPHGAFPEGGAYAVLRELHAGSLEAHWVARPEAVDLGCIKAGPIALVAGPPRPRVVHHRDLGDEAAVAPHFHRPG